MIHESWILLRNLHKPDVSGLNYWSITMIWNSVVLQLAAAVLDYYAQDYRPTGKAIPVPKYHSINKYWAHTKISTHSRPRNWTEVSGKLHGPTALTPVKAVPVPTELGAVSPKKECGLGGTEKIPPFAGNQSSVSRLTANPSTESKSGIKSSTSLQDPVWRWGARLKIEGELEESHLYYQHRSRLAGHSFNQGHRMRESRH